MKKVMFSVVHDVMIKLRFEIVEAVLRSGYETYIVCPHGETVEKLVEMGCKHIDISFNRHSINVIDNLKLLRLYEKIYSSVMPDIVFSYSAQPNIYGGLACKKLKIPYAANITGLGGALGKPGILQPIMVYLYKKALSSANVVFFQNRSNEVFFTNHKITLEQNVLLPGSGVNLQHYSFCDYPNNDENICFLYIGRIMREKGICELVEAAEKVNKNYPNTSFTALGFCEENFKSEFEKLKQIDSVNFLGNQTDVRPFVKKCHAVVLPTYHEGMANVLLESASMGRPVIASDIPGCREAFNEGFSGLGFSPKNTDNLFDTLEKFISLPYASKAEMGRQGRLKMEREFDRSIIVDKYIETISQCL